MELWLKLISSEHALSFCVLYNRHYLINAEQMSNNMIRAVQLQDYCKQVPKHFYSTHYGLLLIFFEVDSCPPIIQYSKRTTYNQLPILLFQRLVSFPQLVGHKLVLVSFLLTGVQLFGKDQQCLLFTFELPFTHQILQKRKKTIAVTSHSYPSQYWIQETQVFLWKEEGRLSAQHQSLPQVILAY